MAVPICKGHQGEAAASTTELNDRAGRVMDAVEATPLGRPRAQSATYAQTTKRGRELLNAQQPFSALRQFHSDLALRNTAPVDIVWIGDSISEGIRSDKVGERVVRQVGCAPHYMPHQRSRWTRLYPREVPRLLPDGQPCDTDGYGG